MNVVIIEDEPLAAQQIQIMLEKQGIATPSIIDSVKHGQKWIRENALPDIFISDIQLGDGLSFDIFKDAEINSHFIFTTAFDEYALRAFQLNAIDYLLKPISEKELEKSLEKYQKMTQAAPYPWTQIKSDFQARTAPNYQNYFLIESGMKLYRIASTELHCVVSEFKQTYLIAAQKWPWKDSLEEMERKLNPAYFFRINRSVIVHKNSIETMQSYSHSRLQITIKNWPDSEIVSREKVKAFKEWLKV